MGYTSIEFSYLVGTVESLSNIREDDEEKKNFSQLCKIYNPEMSKKVCDYAYNIHSSHFHGGNFMFSEYGLEFYSKNDFIIKKLFKKNFDSLVEKTC